MFAHPIVGGFDLRARIRDGEVRIAHRTAGAGAARQHHVGTALDELDHAVVSVELHPMEGGHELVLGIKRHLSEARVGAPSLLGIDAELGGQHDEGGFRRIADDGAIVGNGGVAVEDHPQGEVGEVGHRCSGDRCNRASLAVALAFDAEPSAVGIDDRDHHLVHRQGARLVGVDRARRSQGFDVSEVLHDGLRVGELLGAQRQQSRDKGGKTGRDRGDRHRRAEQEELVRVQAPGKADDDDEGDRGPGDEPEDLRQRVELALQGRSRSRHGRQHLRDLAHLRLHSGGGDDHRCGPPSHGGVLEQHVRAIAERDVRVGERAGVLGNRRALARECGFLGLQGRRVHDSTIGRDKVARFDLDDITRHDVDSGDRNQRSAAHDLSRAALADSTARSRSPAPSAPVVSRAPRSGV